MKSLLWVKVPSQLKCFKKGKCPPLLRRSATKPFLNTDASPLSDFVFHCHVRCFSPLFATLGTTQTVIGMTTLPFGVLVRHFSLCKTNQLVIAALRIWRNFSSFYHARLYHSCHATVSPLNFMYGFTSMYPGQPICEPLNHNFSSEHSVTRGMLCASRFDCPFFPPLLPILPWVFTVMALFLQYGFVP